MTKTNTVLFTGGTHGNELTGVRLIEHWVSLGAQFTRPGISVKGLMTNPKAVLQRVRFVDEDLNRQFALEQQKSGARDFHEGLIATHLTAQIGPQSAAQPDLIVDIHNTTSHMGATLILLANDRFNQQLARFVFNRMPQCNILLEDEKPFEEHVYLCTLGKRGVMIEMGAQPQGVCRAALFKQSIQLLNHIMDFCALWNTGNVGDLPPCKAYRFVENIKFPLNHQGLVDAMVHPSIQDNDFAPLAPGAPAFIDFAGNAIPLDNTNTVYPHFINEAAYQRSHVAFATATTFEW
ncbi:aspartoacylase [Alteromonas sp. ASW11-36]|uniref:Aspartoacylase n=1 Tax=Alteromonas arenosi TaxID=3055817 RepID=A0ABT7STM2_9ALTE|nr:aspartoacylase [Alteromonas sp. ASW11-36]MDM7859541.1 aspartoacylase [Alteromonas sp. ASW11-36]